MFACTNFICMARQGLFNKNRYKLYRRATPGGTESTEGDELLWDKASSPLLERDITRHVVSSARRGRAVRTVQIASLQQQGTSSRHDAGTGGKEDP